MNIAMATTSELVSFFNTHSDTPIRKFADRKTAERRCSELEQKLWAVEQAKVVRLDKIMAAPKAHPDVVTLRPAMVESMKLDRRIVDLTAGVVYRNACRVWKAGVVSSSQCDRLSSVLYSAAKNGDRNVVVSINNHSFTLEVK